MPVFACKTCGTESITWSGACTRCGGKDALSFEEGGGADPLLGKTIAGRYHLIRRLGAGGMGTVYEAEQVGVGNRLAVKFLNAQLSNDADIARRFLNEARTYIRVAHPGAVQLYDFGKDESGSLYLTMELVDGEDIRRTLDRTGPMALADAVDVMLQVAEVLNTAHNRGVIHRDLKPENVMVRRSLRGFHVKVLDFGIAHLAYEGATRLTAAGSVAGTPRYMAPEQVRGETVDARIDIYALGLVFFEMLTGAPAMEGANPATILMHQLTTPVPALGTIDLRLANPQVDAVIATATAKQRDARYPDMLTFASALAPLVGLATRTLEPSTERMAVQRRPVEAGEPNAPTSVRPTPAPEPGLLASPRVPSGPPGSNPAAEAIGFEPTSLSPRPGSLRSAASEAREQAGSAGLPDSRFSPPGARPVAPQPAALPPTVELRIRPPAPQSAAAATPSPSLPPSQATPAPPGSTPQPLQPPSGAAPWTTPSPLPPPAPPQRSVLVPALLSALLLAVVVLVGVLLMRPPVVVVAGQDGKDGAAGKKGDDAVAPVPPVVPAPVVPPPEVKVERVEPPPPQPVRPTPPRPRPPRPAPPPPPQPAVAMVAPTTNPPPAASGDDCPGSDIYDASVRALSNAELEQRILGFSALMPSMRAKTFESLRANLSIYAAEKRPCMYRLSLLASVASQPAVAAAMPNAWVYEVPSSTLKGWYLKYPLRQGWDATQRRSILAQVEEYFIGNLRIDAPGDREYYRRLYVGLLVACSLTQDALVQVKGTRVRDERDCLSIKPTQALHLSDGGVQSFE